MDDWDASIDQWKAKIMKDVGDNHVKHMRKATIGESTLILTAVFLLSSG